MKIIQSRNKREGKYNGHGANGKPYTRSPVSLERIYQRIRRAIAKTGFARDTGQ